MFYYCPNCKGHYHIYSVLDSVEMGNDHYTDDYFCPKCRQPVISVDRIFVPANVTWDYDCIDNSFGGSQ